MQDQFRPATDLVETIILNSHNKMEAERERTQIELIRLRAREEDEDTVVGERKDGNERKKEENKKGNVAWPA